MTGKSKVCIAGEMVLLALLIAGCGGGGASEQGGDVPAGAVSVLTWEPPSTYNDNTPLDPYVDLAYYEIYVCRDVNFTDNETPVAQVAVVTDVSPGAGAPGGRTLVKEFELERIPGLAAGMHYYVSLRAVGIDGQKSAFMTPVEWIRG